MEERITWLYEKSLYREYGALATVLGVLAGVFAAIWIVVSAAGLCGGNGAGFFMDITLCFAALIALFMVIGTLAFYIWAWAHGGKETWEYEMDADGVRAHRLPVKPGRLKALRALTLFAMMFSKRPGQTMVMSQTLRDTTLTRFDLPFAKATGIDPQRGEGRIIVKTGRGEESVAVPEAVFDAALAFMQRHIPAKRTRGK